MSSSSSFSGEERDVPRRSGSSPGSSGRSPAEEEKDDDASGSPEWSSACMTDEDPSPAEVPKPRTAEEGRLARAGSNRRIPRPFVPEGWMMRSLSPFLEAFTVPSLSRYEEEEEDDDDASSSGECDQARRDSEEIVPHGYGGFPTAPPIASGALVVLPMCISERLSVTEFHILAVLMFSVWF